MNKLVNAMSKESNKTTTENGMKIKKSSENALVDLFFAIGASRGNFDQALFEKAYQADKDIAIRIALYARDVRGGMGERKIFRDILTALAIKDYKVAIKVIPFVPVVGRFDDLFAFVGTAAHKEALDFYHLALASGDTLAAKWAPREKSAHKDWAYALRREMGLTSKEYRKLIVGLTNVVETKMTEGRYKDIDYSKLPSLASARYQQAFTRNDTKRYNEYLSALEKGETTINAGAVYPYDVLKSLISGSERAAEQQWKALPDYIQGDKSFLPLIDVSGSMGVVASGSTSCMDIAVSLGLYCSQRCKGTFKDSFLTFTSTPSFMNVSGLSLKSAVSKIMRSEWGMSTNLEAAYDQILNVAVKHKVPQSDMPEMLIIFSDMQFDQATRGPNKPHAMMKARFKDAGYEIPQLVYWNLRDVGKNTAVSFDKEGTALVSGFSPSMMTSVLGDMEQYTPLNVVLEAVMKERYDWNNTKEQSATS